jgi:dolichyl-phosphate beta-glucosyltransferase
MTTPHATEPAPVPRLSVVVPAYNEEQRLGATLERIIGYLAGRDYAWEIIVVDDGSSDSTGAVALRLGAGHALRVLRNEPNQGKGASIRRGMMEARGRFRLFSDADLSTPVEEIEKFWPRFEAGCGVVIGSRAAEGAQLEVRQAWYREMMGRTFNLIVRALLVRGIRDTQCGFKAFTAEAADAVFPNQRLKGFAFDVEAILLARRAGFRVEEVPVRWINSPASKVSALRDSARMFADLLRLKLGL